MSSVDNRTVEMRFNNQQFESGVQTSIKSLDTLKKGLDLDKSAKSLKNLEQMGKSFSLAGISNGISALTNRFSVFGIAADTVIRNIANSAYAAGKQIVHAFTLQPVISGFQEYETQIGAIQTILANTSEEMDKAGLNEQQSLDKVSAKLDELNVYADKTIYNFTEMTRNIGTFTAAGVKLDDSVNAIKGIANLAAASGSTSQQASSAMYQLSQAMSSGTVKLQDWNSVVNAGMGGQLFQNALKRTAKAMNVTVDKIETTTDKSGKRVKKTVSKTVDELIKEAGSFRESLQEGWITSEVLTETLSQLSIDFESIAEANKITVEAAKELKKSELVNRGYTSKEADDIIKLAETANDAATKVKTFSQLFSTLVESAQSGWTQTWELIVGDFGTAKDFLTEVSNHFGAIISASAEARNALVGDWVSLGGRNSLIESLWNIANAVENISAAITTAFFPVSKVIKVNGQDVEKIGSSGASSLMVLTNRIGRFSEKLLAFANDTDKMEKVTNIFKGLFGIFDIGIQAIEAVYSIVEKLLVHFNVGDNFLTFFSDLGSAIYTFSSDLRTDGTLDRYANSFADGIISAIEKLKDYWTIAKQWMDDNGVTESLTGFQEGLNKFFTMDPSGESTLEDKIKARFEPIIMSLESVSEKLKPVFDKIKDLDIVGTIFTLLQIVALFKIYRLLGGASSIVQTVGQTISDIGEGLTGVSDNITYIKWIKIGLAVLAISTAVSLVADSFSNLAQLNWEQIAIGTTGLVGAEGGLVLGVGALVKIFNSFGDVTLRDSVFLEAFSDSVKNLTTSLITIGGLNWNEASVSMGVVTGVEAGLVGSIAALTHIYKDYGHVTIKDSVSIMAYTTSVGNMCDSLVAIGQNNNWDQIAIGMSAVGFSTVNILGGIWGLSAIGKHYGSLSFDFTAATGVLSGSVNMLGDFLTKTSDIGWDEIKIGMSALAGSTLSVILGVGGLAAISKYFGTVKFGVNLATIFSSFSVRLLGDTLLELSKLEWSQIANGLGAINGLQLTITGGVGALAYISKYIGTVKFGVNLSTLFLGGSVSLMANSLLNVCDLSWGEIAVGMTGIALMEGLIIAGVAALSAISNGIGGISFGTGIATFSIGGSVSLLAGQLLEVSKLSWAEIGVGMTALGGAEAAIITGVGALSAITKLIGPLSIKGGFSTIASVIPLVVVMGALTLAVSQIKDVDWTVIAAFSAGVAVMTLALAYSLPILAAIPISGAAKAAGSLIIVAAGLGAAISIIGGLVGPAITGFAEEIFKVGANLDGYSNIVSGINVESINQSISVINDLATMALDIGTKRGYSGFYTFIGFLSTLGSELNLYSTLVNGIDTYGSQYAKTMIDDVEYIYGKMNDMSSNGDINLDTLSLVLTNIGSGLSLYSQGVKDIAANDTNETPVDTSFIKTMFEDLATNLPTSEVLNKVAEYAEGGGNDLTSYALGLTAIGGAIESYSSSIANLKLGDVLKSNLMLSMMSDLATGLPSYGSCFEYFNGKQLTLDQFSTDIVSVGGAMSSFATSVKDVNFLSVGKAELAILMLSKIQNGLNPTGSVFSFITGTSDLGTFGTKIMELGAAFAKFGADINSINLDDTKKATEPIDALAEIDKKMHEIENSGDWFTSTNSLSTLGDGIAELGTDFATFIGGLTGVTIPDNIEYVLSIINYIQTIALRLYSQSYNSQFAHFDFASYMRDVGVQVKGFFDNVDSVKNADCSTAISFIEKFKDIVIAIKDIPKDGWFDLSDYIKFIGDDVKAFFNTTSDIDPSDADALGNFVYNIAQSAAIAQGLTDTSLSQLQALLNSFATLTIPEFKDEGKIAALEYASGLALGLEESLAGLIESADELISACLTSINDQYKNWYDTGRYLALGLALGITSRTSFIQEAAINAANAGVAAIQTSWNEHSPSKVAEELGMNFDYGLANGLGNYSKVVEQSATDVGKSSIDSAKLMLANLSNDIFGDLDNEPTIRPVIDMTDVTNGVDTINGMFSANRSVNAGIFAGNTFKRNAGELAFDGNKIVGALDNKAVVTAINDLTNKFDELSDAVAGIDIVLDGGTLVGQLGTKIDRNLGVLAARRGRGN